MHEREITGPAFVFANRSIDTVPTDDPDAEKIAFVMSEDVWFVPPDVTVVLVEDDGR